MLALCKLEYTGENIDTGANSYYHTQCLINGKNLTDITNKLIQWYGEDIATYTITPIDDLIPIPLQIYDKMLNDLWTLDQLETKLY